MPVKKGDKVKVEYEGKLEDGTVFDASEKHGAPLEFVAGQGMVVPGFDNAVLGMEKGEEKEVTIPPEEAYGPVREQLVKEIPRSQLPPEPEPKVGMLVGVGLPNGAQLPARIVEVTADNVKLDLNHPLAGKTLKFKIKVVEITEGEEAKEEPKTEA